MPLADSLEKELFRYKKGRDCAAVRFLKASKLSREDAEAYRAVLENINPHSADFLPATRLAALARSEGYSVSASSIDRHRNQTCPCYRVVD